jgi:hypothetical protein
MLTKIMKEFMRNWTNHFIQPQSRRICKKRETSFPSEEECLPLSDDTWIDSISILRDSSRIRISPVSFQLIPE